MLSIYPFIVVWVAISLLAWQVVFSMLEGHGNVHPISFSSKVLGSCIMTLAVGSSIVLSWFLTGLMFGYS